MDSVASRELRNNTRSLLSRVEAGERIQITVAGRPVAVLAPIGARRRWVRRDAFVDALVQADPDLAADIARLAPDTTDDLAG